MTDAAPLPAAPLPAAPLPAADLALARAGIDRDHLTREGADAEARILADPATRAIVLRGRDALLERTDPPRLALVPIAALGTLPEPVLHVYLGRTLDDEHAPIIAVILPDGAVWPDGASADEAAWADLRAVATQLDDRDAGLFTEALAMANWHAVHAFSPKTGEPTTSAKAGWVRVDAAGAEYYPRTDAAIIVAVLDEDDRLLLGHNALWPAGRVSLIAGFVEPGESLEAAVVREVFEETGLTVTAPHYLGSQPWPFPASLMLGFEARVAAGTDATPRPDGVEITELTWFTRAELASPDRPVTLPGGASIARAIIERWAGGPLEEHRRF